MKTKRPNSRYATRRRWLRKYHTFTLAGHSNEKAAKLADQDYESALATMLGKFRK